MQKDTEIIIKDFEKGIADSPHLGFADMRNIDLSIPGLAQTNYRTDKQSSTTITALPYWIANNPANNGYVYALDSSQKVYTNGGSTSWSHVSGNTTSAANGNGLAVWKDHLFAIRNAKIDVYGALSGTPSWSNDWQSLAATNAGANPAIWAQDDILYIGNGRYVASVQENAGQDFAKGTAATYTYNSQALDLPENETITCMEENGRFLLLGTSTGKIYPWDRSSDSFNLPVFLDNNPVRQMKTIGNITYAVAGRQNRIYATNGTSVQFIRELPASLVGINPQYASLPGAIAAVQGALFFGTKSVVSAVPDVVWSYNKGRLNVEHYSSYSDPTYTSYDTIGALFGTERDTLYIGWANNTTYGIDVVNTSGYRTDSYQSYFISPIYKVGNSRTFQAFEELEILLDEPLATGQGVKVSYRTDTNASFTTLATFDYATYPSYQSNTFPAGSIFGEIVQLKVELKSNNNGTTSPKLREVRLR